MFTAKISTLNLLEKRAAEIFGREDALFVPTGTMGNQIAIRLHTQPGQEVICRIALAHSRLGDGSDCPFSGVLGAFGCHGKRDTHVEGH